MQFLEQVDGFHWGNGHTDLIGGLVQVVNRPNQSHSRTPIAEEYGSGVVWVAKYGVKRPDHAFDMLLMHDQLHFRHWLK